MKTPSNSKTISSLAPASLSRGLLAAAVLSLALVTAKADIGYQFVTVGNAGNAADSSTGFGAVPYTYQIGKYEVTLTQYTAFLNAVAASDPNALYNGSMGTDLNIAGISRAGVSGGYTYAVIGEGNRPVTYVSMLDAMRFANWVNNGQGGAGTTETGAYTLSLGGMAPRNGGASVFVASENEWYKAAYYDPVSAGADALGTADYWRYATRSDSLPGNVVGAAANQANSNLSIGGVYSVTQSSSYSSTQNYLTAGGAYSNSASYYGTYDQNGNVVEWNEIGPGFYRKLRGGAWDWPISMTSGYWDYSVPEAEYSDIGFRLTSIEPVPEPTGIVTGLLCLWVAALRRRRRSVS